MRFDSLARARRIGATVILLAAAGLALIALTRTPPGSVSDGPSRKIARAAESTCENATTIRNGTERTITYYLISESNALLRPMLEKQLGPGSRVVSHNYPIAGWEDRQTGATSMKDAEGKDHTIYVYVR